MRKPKRHPRIRSSISRKIAPPTPIAKHPRAGADAADGRIQIARASLQHPSALPMRPRRVNRTKRPSLQLLKRVARSVLKSAKARTSVGGGAADAVADVATAGTETIPARAFQRPKVWKCPPV